MIRTAARLRRTGLAVTAAALIGCGGPEATTPATTPQAAAAASSDSPIAGTTLDCERDYPDSRLVFAPDGTLGGRYAGREVTGHWTAAAPGQVELVLRTGGMTVRDTLRRTERGWQGQNFACG